MPEVVILLVLIGVFFLLVVRPQRARQQAAQRVRESVQVGDTVMTTSGLHGQVVDLDSEVMTLQVAPGVHIRWARAAVASVTAPAGSTTGGTSPADSSRVGRSGADQAPPPS